MTKGTRRPKAAKYPENKKRGFAAASASFFLSDQKETKESLGAAHGHLRCPTPLAPRPPFLRGESAVAWAIAAGAGALLKVGLIVIAAALLNDLEQMLLPVCSAPRLSSILPGRWSAGGQSPPPNHDPAQWSWFGEEEQGNGVTNTRQGVRSEMDFATTISLPLSSITCSDASTRYHAPGFPSIHRGRWRGNPLPPQRFKCLNLLSREKELQQTDHAQKYK